jgi:hypothetical protein
VCGATRLRAVHSASVGARVGGGAFYHPPIARGLCNALWRILADCVAAVDKVPAKVVALVARQLVRLRRWQLGRLRRWQLVRLRRWQLGRRHRLWWRAVLISGLLARHRARPPV